MKTKIKVALIGLGKNAANYHDGLMLSNNLELAVICDVNPNAVSRSFYNDVPFVEDYKQILNLCKVEYVFIVTPPAAHLEIAQYFLKLKTIVILEKPPFPSYRDLFKINGSSNATGIPWLTAYHWQFGPEVERFRDFVMPIMGKLISVQTTVFDPYFEKGSILPEKVGLLGAWLDSGSNVLSMYNYLFRNLNPEIIRKEFRYDRNLGMPFYSHVEFLYHSTLFSITIDWTKGVNQKRTVFNFENGIVVIEHSQQEIFINGTLDSSFNERPRLLNHYYNMLNNFSILELKKRKMNRKTLHFLYKVNENEGIIASSQTIS